MKPRKLLGQIAYEADKITSSWGLTWEEASSGTRSVYERIAQAVARAVKRREGK
jgi:hypothetical protein